MSTFTAMQHLQQDMPSQQSRSYGHYIDSNPSSTHSSPRTFPSDLDSFYPTQHTANLTHSQTYPIPAGSAVNPYIPAQQRRPHPHMQASRSSSYSSYTAPVSLQVSTSTSSAAEHDPNERTARPGNAHLHAQFHRGLAGATASSSSLSLNSNAFTSDSGAGPGIAENGGGDGDVSGAPQTDYDSSTSGLSAGLSRPLKQIEQERLAHLDRLKFFLATAPSRWDSAAANANPPPPVAAPPAASSSSSSGFPGSDFSSPFASGTTAYGAGAASGGFPGPSMGLGGLEPSYHHAPPHPALNRFLLPNQEFVTCVLWNGLYHITGTDIVRALVFRFEAFGRPVRNMKKFEEGVFSDLRNLKPGVDACLEEPKSPFLDLLFKYQCIRTQKKQKVFYWFSVPHDRLFLDALERDLKREKMGLEPTTQIVGEPALSFTYDPKRSLYEQFSKAQGTKEGESESDTAASEDGSESRDSNGEIGDGTMVDDSEPEGDNNNGGDDGDGQQPKRTAPSTGPHTHFKLLSLFEGSPTYKMRRKKGSKAGSGLRKGSEDFPDDYERGRSLGGGGSDRFSASLSRERHNARPAVPMPAHASMMEEFGPGGAGEQEHAEPSAADLFLLQAKGQLMPANGVVRKPKQQPIVGEVVYYHQGDASAQQQQQRMMSGHMRGRSIDETNRDPAQVRPSPPMSAGFATTTFQESQEGQQAQTQPVLTSISQYEAVSADGKVRAFVCPLYSCGRLFKRMEHLKRHLRTHTMERPFTCPRCNKKFSRSDNLTQHLRTHERTGHGPLPGNTQDPNGGWMDPGEDTDVSAGEGSANGGSPRASSVTDGEDDGALQGMLGFGSGGMGGLGMFDSAGISIDGMDMSTYGMLSDGVQPFGIGQLDANMCEVEVQGGVQDVQGDEEGLLMRTGGIDSPIVYTNQQQHQQQSASDGYFSVPSSAPTSGMLFSASTNSGDFSDTQWINRPQASPAFSNVSAPSPPPGSVPMMRNSNRASVTSSPAGYLRSMQPHHSHSSSSSASSNYGDDYSTSLSAPSHKLSFDQGTLLAPGLMDTGNVGPVRRHRSMTPSIVRNGEPIRRPMTANSGEFQGVSGGSPASVSSMNSTAMAARGYHPYAYSNSNSRTNSTHNSPQVHPIPLGNEYAHAQIHRSESRNSSYGGVGGLQEQMRQMMNMNDGSAAGAAGAGGSSVFGDTLFRTGSPASFQQTESPAAFNMDLPLQYTSSPGFMPHQGQQQQILHASTMPNQYGASQQEYDGYFVQPHATL